MKFRYQLSKKEIEDAVFCIEWKRIKRYYGKHFWISCILGFCILVEYICQPEKIYLFFVILVIIAMLGYLVYAPIVSRRGKIKRMMQVNGEYQVEIKPDYIVSGNDGLKIPLDKKDISAVYTKNVFVLQIARDWVAIPRKMLQGEQEIILKEILRKHNCQITELIVEKRGAENEYDKRE